MHTRLRLWVVEVLLMFVEEEGGKNVKGLNGIKGQCAHRKKTQAGERALAKQKQK
uniref:Uncharacterized protein n=1 Tax=Candidozyma auris TaxID=498019 RepID=A0A0L0P8G9_CANAR